MDTAANVYNDFSGLSRLKAQAGMTPDQAVSEVAKQFESLFLGMMMKAMRDTLPQDGLFSSNQMTTYQEMFDQQLALDLSGKGGIGLARLIEDQLTRADTLARNHEAGSR